MRSPVVLLIVLFLLPVLAGCTGSPMDGTPPPATMTPSPATTDLTNRYSAQAAQFRNGTSVTVLEPESIPVRLTKIAGTFTAPMMIATDGSGRLFVADQIGTVRIIGANGTVYPEPFLDLRDRMIALSPQYDERGLYAIAFHPDSTSNGRVFVHYAAPLRQGAPAGWSCTNRLSEFRVMAGNPDRVDPASEKILLAIDKPQMNHNGGPILFGPDDGYLYIALGDGGGADDTGAGHTPGTGNAQDPATLLGKVIRIDVDSVGTGGKAYAIPQDNPFMTNPAFLPEIYAMGLRNPAYLSFDAGGNHTLTTGVAGQELFESVFFLAKGGNYGWKIREGTHCFDPEDAGTPPPEPCATTGARGEPLIGPVVETGHDIGNTIVGGYIYRGTDVPALSGKYIFGMWSTGFTSGDGSIYAATPPAGYDIRRYPASAKEVDQQDNRMWTFQKVLDSGTSDGRPHAYVRGFGQDDRYELYVLLNTKSGPDPSATTGEVWKIGPAA